MNKYVRILLIMCGFAFSNISSKACSCGFAPGDSTFFTSVHRSYNTTSFFVLKGFKTHFVQGGVGYKVLDKVIATSPIPDTIMIFGDLTGSSCNSTPQRGIGDTTYILLSRRFMASGAPTFPLIDSGDFTAWLCEHNTLTFYQDSVYTFGPMVPYPIQRIRLSEQDFIDSLRGMLLNTESVGKEKSLVSIYPNPTHDKLYLKLEPSLEIEQAIIYSGLGQKSKLIMINNDVDVSHLPSGIYFLNLRTNKGIIRRKFIVQH